MLLPAFVHGLAKDVKSRTGRIVTKLARGVPWEEATAGPVVDTSVSDGLIVLHGPSPQLVSAPHFHVYLPLQEMLYAMLPSRARLPASMRDTLFEAALGQAWSTLALQGPGNQLWLARSETLRPFLRATLRFWPEFDDAPRYSQGLAEGSWLWDCPAMARYALIQLGVPQQAVETRVHTAAEIRQILETYSIEL